MGKINVGRLILGGIVAGIVGDLLDFPVDGVWLAKSWNDGMQALGHSPDSRTKPDCLVQPAWTRHWACRDLDLRRDPAALRPGRENGNLRRSSGMDSWLPGAERRFHVRTGPFLASPCVLHNARVTRRVCCRDDCGSCSVQGRVETALRRGIREQTVRARRNAPHGLGGAMCAEQSNGRMRILHPPPSGTYQSRR